MLSRIRFWGLACTMLALVWGCGSSSTVTPVDGGKGDAKSDAADGHVDSGPEVDTGAPDSTMADTSMPDTSMGDTSTGDTSTGDTSPPPDAADSAPATFTVGGMITGTMGETVTLQDNNADNLPISGDGSFTFTTPLASGAAFNVTLLSEPANLNCTIMSGTGTIANGNVTSVLVSCVAVAVDGGTDTGTTVDSGTMEAAAGTVFIGGTVTGLSGTLVLDDNGGNPLTINSNGSFTFSQTVATGSPYAVTVGTQPASPVQVCTVTMGSGTAPASNVTSVAVNCVTTSFTVGVTISGLTGTVVLQDNGGDNLSETANGTYTFATAVASGAPYSVTVLTQPALQTCVVGATGAGTIGNANVTGITVTCGTPTFTIGGTVSGLPAGQSIVLNDNGGDADTVSASGGFTFATALANGAAYAVTIKTQPAGAVCTLAGATGTVSGANVSSVVVNCAAGTFTVGGTITGLAPGDSVQLENNGANSSFFSGNGGFAFSTALPTGGAYVVTVQANPAQPTSQTCTVTNGSGTVGTMNVSSVAINCVTNTYTVSGKVVLLNTGADVITLTDNLVSPFVIPANSTSPASFTFSQAVPSSSPFNVVGTAAGPVTLAIGGVPGMSCFALTSGQTNSGVTATSNASGTVTNVNVTGIVLVCQAAQLTVSARAVGLGAGDSIQLNLNGGGAGNTVGLNSVNPGPTAFGNTINSGSIYNVTLAANPTAPVSQTCTLGGNASGTAGGANFTVTVTCVTNNFTFTANVTGATGNLFQLVNADANAGNGQLCPASIVCTAADTPSPCCLQNNGSVSLGSMASGTAFAFQPINGGVGGTNAICTVTPSPASPVGNAVVNLNILCDPDPQSLTVNFTNVDGLVMVNDTSVPVGGDGTVSVSGNVGGPPAPTGASGSLLLWSIESNATYDVTVVPGACGHSVCFTGEGSANQDCVVSNGTGTTGNTMGGGINNINVVCTTNNFQLGVLVTGNTGTNLINLNSNGVNSQPGADTPNNQIYNIPAGFNGVSETPVPSGSTYGFTFNGYPACNNPAGEGPGYGTGCIDGAGHLLFGGTNPAICTLSNAGSVGTTYVGNADDNLTVSVDCQPMFSVSTTFVTYTGMGLELSDGTDNTQGVDGNIVGGVYTFPTFLPAGTVYNVAIPGPGATTYPAVGQPTGPVQSCAVTSGGGSHNIAGNVSVVVTCTLEPTHRVNIQITGVEAGNGFFANDLYGNNTPAGGNDGLAITSANNGASTLLSAAVAIGQNYQVVLSGFANNPTQNCQFVGSNFGVMGPADVTVVASCAPALQNGTSCGASSECASLTCGGANLCVANAGGTGAPCGGTCGTGVCDTNPSSATYESCQ